MASSLGLALAHVGICYPSSSDEGSSIFRWRTNAEKYYHYNTAQCNTNLLRNIEKELAMNSKKERAGVTEMAYLHMDSIGYLSRKPKEDDISYFVPAPPNVTVVRSTVKSFSADTSLVYMLLAEQNVGTRALVNLIASEISVNQQVAPKIHWNEFITEKLKIIRYKHGIYEAMRWQQLYREQLMGGIFVPLSLYQLLSL